jgi:rubrerythrin
MDDLISRTAAIDALRTCYDTEAITYTNENEYISYDQALSEIEGLPPAEPKKICIAKITLSEKQIREAIEKTKNEIIQVLSSAQSKRKTGEWKKIGHWGRCYRCDQCGNILDFDGVNAGRGDANFCPNCGADIRGEQDEL